MRLYKILPAVLWATADATVPWAPVDVADGFFHLSDEGQVEETARKHFLGQRDLVLLILDPALLHAGTLRWEPSRGGALFPHVYGEVPRAAVVEERPLPPIEATFRLG